MSKNFEILSDDEVNDEDLYIMKRKDPKDLFWKDKPRGEDEHIHEEGS